MSTCCILFVKNPEPGKVKTRLQSGCSPEAAAELYRAFILDCAATLAESKAERKVVAYAPADAGAAIGALLAEIGDFELIPQPELDLGRRMAQMAEWSFATGAERTAIIGSDSPSLPVGQIDAALAMLAEREVVIGPSTDGGYYLIGLRAGECSDLFTGVEWSTGRVLEQTLARLGERRLGLLAPWYDVDVPPEAGFLKIHLEALQRAGSGVGKRSLEALRRMSLPAPS